MDINKYTGILKKKLFPFELYYSQHSEDILVYHYFFDMLGKKSIRYIDIGANDPVLRSNTYLFYKRGIGTGVLIEPNEVLCKRIKRKRPRDIVINKGIGNEQGALTYYMFKSHVLNTFSKEEAERYKEFGRKFKGTKTIGMIPLNKVLQKHGKVDFMTIDAEGMDFEILKSIDYDKYAPLCICVETSEYMGGKEDDFEEMNSFMFDRDYYIYADTGLNTIYALRQNL